MNVNTQPAPLNSQLIAENRVVGFEFAPSHALRAERPKTTLVWSPTPVWKRVLDVVLSATALVVLSPLMLVIAAYIRSVSPGPAIFKQARLGEMGRYFTIYKFRTMHSVDPDLATSKHREYVSSLREQDQVVSKPDMSHCLIPGGAFLRARSLDELPQLFNVLIGNMSLIGPRPDVLDMEDYSDSQLKRFEVKPGISGLWQVSGKNRLSFSRMMELDTEYVQRRSFWLDMWITWRTIKLILSQDNC